MATSTVPRETAAAGPPFPSTYPSPPEPPPPGPPDRQLPHRLRPAAQERGQGTLTIAALASAILIVAALVVQPQWPVQFVNALLWFGGIWRPAAVPLAALLVVAVVVANTAAPGRTWRTLCAWARRALRRLPAAAAVVVALSAAGYSAGLLAPGAVLWALVLLALQVALFPGTPLVAALAALAAAVLVADARRQRAMAWFRAAWAHRPRAPETALRASWPAALTWLAGALIAAALFPDAMQGWGRADAPDAQRYNFYTSFFNYSFNDERVVQRDGFDLGGCGLTLAPGASGSITFRLERTPESLVFLKANFYDLAT